jgi:hypothetical protein
MMLKQKLEWSCAYFINTAAYLYLKVRDEIEQLLDDDGDMAEMYLTDKLLAQQEGSVTPTSPGHGFGPVSPSGDSHAPSTLPPYSLEDPTLQSDGQASDGEDGYVWLPMRYASWYSDSFTVPCFYLL